MLRMMLSPLVHIGVLYLTIITAQTLKYADLRHKSKEKYYIPKNLDEMMAMMMK